MMDALAIQAAEAAVHANYPMCGALLLVELDGPIAEVASLMAHVSEICRTHAASEIRALPNSDAERATRLERPQKPARFACHGPHLSELHRARRRHPPHISTASHEQKFQRLSAAAGIRVANISITMPGDGNPHPLESSTTHVHPRPATRRAESPLRQNHLDLCIAAGGSITGEHGVGQDKKYAMSKMFAEPDLATMQRVRCAFDPLNLSNPTKVFPTPRLCGEKPGEYVPHASRNLRRRRPLTNAIRIVRSELGPRSGRCVVRTSRTRCLCNFAPHAGFESQGVMVSGIVTHFDFRGDHL